MTLAGDNGLLNRTTAAKKKTEEAGIMEQIRIAYQNALIGQYTKDGKGIEAQIEEDLKAIYGNEVQVVYENGVYTVTIPEGTYIIDGNGNISKKKGIKVESEEILLQIVDGEKPEAVTIAPIYEGLENETKTFALSGAEVDQNKVDFTDNGNGTATIKVAEGNITEGTAGDLTIRITAGTEEEEIKVRVKIATSIKTFDSIVIEGEETAEKTITKGNEAQRVTIVATVNNSESTNATEELVWSVNEEYRETVEIGTPVIEGKNQKVEVEIKPEAVGGNIIITAKTQEKEGRNELSRTATITVNIPASGIKMKKTGETTYIDPANPPTIKIAPNTGTVGLTAEVEPSTASNQNINWSIETTPASGVASLSATTGSSVTVNAGSTEGTATVTATSAGDSSKNVSVTISVEKIEQEPNAPNVGKLASKKYVTWTQSGSTYTISETTTAPTQASDWYNYRNGQWANIKTEANGIPSYWVWIPRFAYKQSDLTGTIKQIDVKFVGTDVTSTNVSTSIGAGYAVHPAFNFGGTQLEGFWVAKYEANAYNPTASATVTADYGGGTPSPVTTYKVQSVPGQQSWRNISAENIFTVCQAMTASGGALNGIAATGVTIDSHMMKNREWGAVAILSQSKYGVYNPTSLTGTTTNVGDNTLRVWNNPNGYDSNKKIYTGYVGTSEDASTTYNQKTAPTNVSTYNSATGPKASTTGTVYGVYDMAGGSWEYVAGCYSSTGTEFGSGKNAKYYDTYNSSEQRKVLAITAWNGDYSGVVSESRPVFGRGGDCSNSAIAGVFASDNVSGSAYSSCSFRPVWVAP